MNEWTVISLVVATGAVSLLVAVLRRVRAAAASLLSGVPAPVAPEARIATPLPSPSDTPAIHAETTTQSAARARAMPQSMPPWAEAMPCVVWKADRSGHIWCANKGWLRNYRTVRPLKVEDLVELLANDAAGVFIDAWDAAQRTGADVELRGRMQRPGERAYRWVDLKIRAVDETAGDGRAHWVGTIVDVHDAMGKIENAQGALREERRLRERAERLASMKDEFLSTVSHELRAPLNAIVGWSELLSRERALPATALHAVQVIQRNARSQAKLISSLQELTAMVTGKVAMNPVHLDLNTVADAVLRRHAPAAQAKGIDLSCALSGQLPVIADLDRLTQIITQLIDNALKFTAAGGAVDVRTSAMRETARLVVTDNGAGISAERLPQLFDCLRPPEHPAEGGAERRDGLCIGLAVARGLAELQEGSLNAQSAGVGLGSTFTLCLPLHTDETLAGDSSFGREGVNAVAHSNANPVAFAGPTSAQASPLEALVDLRVLVLDPDRDSRELVRIALTTLRAHVEVAETPDIAVDMLAAMPFDAVVYDVPAAAAEVFANDARNAAGAKAPVLVAIGDTQLAAGSASASTSAPPVTVRKPVSLRTLAEAITGARSQPVAGPQRVGAPPSLPNASSSSSSS